MVNVDFFQENQVEIIQVYTMKAPACRRAWIDDLLSPVWHDIPVWQSDKNIFLFTGLERGSESNQLIFRSQQIDR